MGLFGLSLPKRREITNLASRVYDQANIFDNNRTFKQRTPTNTKSAFQQGGQFTGQLARGTAGGLAKMANTAAAQQSQIYATQRMVAANLTNNPTAFRNASRFADAANQNFTENKGGLLNTGTFYSAEDAKKGELGTGVKKIGGGTAQAMLEAYSLGTAAPVGASVKQFGIREGLKQTAPALGKTFLANTAQGGVTTANQGGTRNDILKSAALSGVLGTAGDVGLGIGGAYASKAAKNALPAVSAKAKAVAKNEGGYIDFKGKGGGKQMTSALDAQAYKDFDGFYKDYKPFFDDSNLNAADARAVYAKAIKEPAIPTGTRGSRVSSSAQTQFEQAYNTGDMATAKRFAENIEDPTARKVALESVDRSATAPVSSAQVQNPQVKAMIEAAQARKKQPVSLLSNESGGIPLEMDAPAPKPTITAKQPNAPATIDDNLEKAIFGEQATPNYKVTALGRAAETLSPNRQLRKLTKPLEGAERSIVRASLESGNKVLRTPGRTVVGLSRQFGRTADELDQLGKFQGRKQYGDELAKKVVKSGVEAEASGVRKEAVAAALDPELTVARGGKAPELNPQELAEVDKLKSIFNITHEGNYKLGLLDEKRYLANKDKYVPRDFSQFFENDMSRRIARNNGLDTKIFKGRKGLEEIPKEVLDKAEKDPYYLAALRVQQFEKNKAIVDQVKNLADTGTLSDTPKSGFVKVPDSPAYKALKGKYVLKEQLEDIEGFIYETDVAQNIVSLLTAYDRNPLRKALKSTKTVYNPGVRLGNRTFNYLTSSLNGINPITFTKNYALGRKMIKNQSPEYLEATKAGIFGSSIIDKELYRTGNVLDAKSSNILKKANEAMSTSYGKVDDEGKMATYLTFRNRGLSVEEAAERTRRAMQNYDMVGNLFDLGAKTPIGGNAFVRFSSELMRIGHNTAIDNPARAVGAMAAVVALTTLASQASGETPEDRKTREERLGAARIPFTNQSLEVQTPWGAVNVGRLLGVTTYNDLTGGFQEETKRMLPFQSPVTTSEDGLKFNPNFVTSDPLVGPIMGQIIDKDFRGKSIKDPENNGQIREPLSDKEQLTNRLKTAAMSYVPLANEADSIFSAAKKDENFYGKERSLPQALLRTAGIKVEEFGSEQAKKQRDINAFFDERGAIDKEAQQMTPEAAEAYKRVTGYYKTRTDVPNEFDPGKTRKQKEAVYKFPEDKWKDYATHPELYDLIRNKKLKEKARQGSPIQPEFDDRLSLEFRKQLINNKSLAPGEDVEADERMYANPEWDAYQKIKNQYEAEAKKYYPKSNGEFVDELVSHKSGAFPEKGPAKAAYDKAYQAYAEGKGAKPEYNDQVDADKQAYNEAKRVWTNNERKARGLPPISPEVWDNVTFGYMSDEEKVYNQLKYGKGYGSYSKYGKGGGSGGGGGGSSDGFNVSKYLSSISGSSSGSKPKVSVSVKAKKIAARSTSAGQKPKVTMKKSKV